MRNDNVILSKTESRKMRVKKLTIGISLMMLICLGSIMSCDSNPIKPEPVTGIFTVFNTEQWEAAINFIKKNGDDKFYVIDIKDDFAIDGLMFPNFTFDDVRGITVFISGSHTISLSSIGSLLRIGSYQSITINDLVLFKPDTIQNYHTLVSITGDESVFTMQGSATVMNNGSTGVHVGDFGKFNMLDNATVTHNSTGVLVIRNGEFNMKDQSSIAFNRWGGIYVADESTFNMIGGSIYENTSDTRGGGCAGVLVSELSIFTMSGGAISNNTELGGGVGGVRIERDSIFMMSNGVISGNSSRSFVGSVFISYGTFKMLDGIISGNKGGLKIDRNSSFTMVGGIIYGSQAYNEPVNLINEIWSLSITDSSSITQYGDGSSILPHIDGHDDYTEYTIVGKK